VSAQRYGADFPWAALADSSAGVPNPGEDGIAARGMNSCALNRGLERNHGSGLRGARNMVLLHEAQFC
jgi:hypothetical protein